ncbi:hypothetical protein CROQUDRAFT_98406 [Cronartium quercuum f. sp. fusiforme G11]|uniref:Uncharacterized protein n=1 Tax=Cronartium quercuum f. sp. fusiforme G11 TaxID=708437 RepID=A0A9P6NCI3_9BASI|nr:hypothetical protein CROQUDRAFT_98406 [Cronartium quercuum f. sp. fusiforme G11]
MADDLEMTRKELRKLKADKKKTTRGKANAAMIQADNNSSDTIDLSDSDKSMTLPSEHLTNLRPASTHVTLADKSVIKATATGTTILPLTIDKTVSMLQVPGLNKPLLSVSDLVDEGLVLEFNEHGCDI